MQIILLVIYVFTITVKTNQNDREKFLRSFTARQTFEETESRTQTAPIKDIRNLCTKTATLRKRMTLCSFASLVGGACGPSPENPAVNKFVYVRDCDRDLKAHLKLCKILTNIESIDSKRKLLLTRAGKYNGIIFFLIFYFWYRCIEKRLLIFYLGIFVAQECQLHMTICPNTGMCAVGAPCSWVT